MVNPLVSDPTVRDLRVKSFRDSYDFFFIQVFICLVQIHVTEFEKPFLWKGHIKSSFGLGWKGID